ncbi:MAG TPA: glycosyltransferase family A protein [Thermoanaerobaculia bacterium]|nr:glycosyltransferase family A protein [Thermoanaerobaculia bacterium]
MSAVPTPSSDLPLVTVFTSTVYPDVVRLWHAAVTRAFPAAEARIEIFQDSDRPLDPALYPGVTRLSRTPERREFHDAYNDAIQRVATPYLAFIDSDVFWLSPDLWPWARERLADPKVAAVSYVSRKRRPSHGTFAVVMKVAAYREVFARSLPLGFFPRAENPDPEVPFAQWVWYDTGDLATQALVDAGWQVDLLHRDEQGELFRFHGITLSRRGAEHVGPRNLARLAGQDEYYFRGYAGNLVLKSLHDRLFPEGPAYDFPLGPLPLARESRRGSPEELQWRRQYWRYLEAGARRVEAFLRAPGPGGWS